METDMDNQAMCKAAKNELAKSKKKEDDLSQYDDLGGLNAGKVKGNKIK
jgi:hypothetical protein